MDRVGYTAPTGEHELLIDHRRSGIWLPLTNLDHYVSGEKIVYPSEVGIIETAGYHCIGAVATECR